MNMITNEAVSLDRDGAVLIATVDNPPVNALSHAVRAGLVSALDQFEADAEAKALVILCAGRTFIAGADIREFGQPLKEPRLGALIDRLDRCEKPVVAAMHGTALGGGLEIALACSYRLASQDARMGLPEVKLGLLPGSGGIVRLPRLIGVPDALTMIAEGGQIGAAAARDKGLVDEVVSGDLRSGAVAFTQGIAEKGEVRRTSDLPVPAFDEGLLATRRAELAKRYRGLKAPQIAVDLIEMMTITPFAEAVEKEYATCRELIASPQSKALRHLFAAERAALKIDGVPADTQPRKVSKVAVIGPGVMGRGIAMCFMDAALPVVLLGRSEESLGKAEAAIRKLYGGSIKRGSMTEAQLEERMKLLETVTDYERLADVDLVVEAVTENLSVKKDVFARLSGVLKPDAIIATNTSFLDIEALASSAAQPQNVAGMHFFNPANMMKLLENVRASRTDANVLATITALGKKIGKVPVMVGRSEGFVANRMLSKRSREAQFLLEDGATPQQVDKVLSGFGFPIGPFALADLAGMDVMAAARQARIAGMTPREQACNIVDKLAAAGRLGQKTGAGYYLYGEDRKPQHDPAVGELLAAHRTERGFGSREITDEEILERCLLAMVNEAAKLLDEGAAARASDIDVIWTSGFGWPTHMGGPMFWADQMGIARVKEALDKYSRIVGEEYFKPAALIERLASEGRGFHN
ncbi:3-hydroxyacyl-CoA dehydrogenase NAD-binding domain-containing protein [Aquamicrobium sp. LC103]|uniref:3-hydroxyacyl-CoA dehydrogenase NAD-binding domain-containing protein n=1 Tax=Aquamicrobium sp. LC103 TaxID=1120658 RepID=UPI00063E9ED5|nr:3-hydroxyacyl-CoA dehydrogenase NAD-binding domain-containing protein [Aquamicrobium sp. LC103]TKT75745.1 3-hydroxyacyl-CoA dehydrogenase [Aquamicrobium sp. LC103]